MTEPQFSEQSLLPNAATLERLALSSSGFLSDPVTGHSFTLNETGRDIVRILQEKRDLKALKQQLLRERR